MKRLLAGLLLALGVSTASAQITPSGFYAVDGNASAPSYSYASEPTLGCYRSAAATQTCTGTTVFGTGNFTTLNVTGSSVLGNGAATSVVNITGQNAANQGARLTLSHGSGAVTSFMGSESWWLAGGSTSATPIFAANTGYGYKWYVNGSTTAALNLTSAGIFSVDTNDFTVSRASNAGNVISKVQNTSNTANSVAELRLQSGGTSGGDRYLSFYDGTGLYSIGVASGASAIRIGTNAPTGGTAFVNLTSTLATFPAAVTAGGIVSAGANSFTTTNGGPNTPSAGAGGFGSTTASGGILIGQGTNCDIHLMNRNGTGVVCIPGNTISLKTSGQVTMANAGTPPTCTTNCGTSPSVSGSDSAGIITMGASGVPASGFVLQFNGTWGTAPACIVQMYLAGMVVGKMPLTVATTTTTFTVVTNGTAPATSDKYVYHCIGIS